MSRTSVFLALALSLSAAPACDEFEDSELTAEDDIALRNGSGFGSGGVKLNTSAIGDHLLHAIHLAGKLHEDVELLAVYIRRPYKNTFTWVKLDEVWAEKGQLKGRSGDKYFDAAHFVGSRWDLRTYGGGAVDRWMTIHAYRWDAATKNHKYTFAYPMDPNYGLHAYGKQGKPIDGTELLSLCGSKGGSLEAVVYEDTDVDMKTAVITKKGDILSIACLDGALGKSGDFGYRPYEIDHKNFQAIVRSVRADYCGDGDSWTKPGTPIDMEDKWGINKFFDSTAKTESLWTSEGALCVTLPRRPEFDEVKCGEVVLKDCGDAKLGSFGVGELVWTKTP